MADPFDANLIPISRASITSALERAMRYRLLNDPEGAESICLDILDVDPENQDALVTIILAISDQFGAAGYSTTGMRWREYVARLTSEYQQNYYTGVILERRARALLREQMGHAFAFDGLREAMDWFERAAAIRPEGEDEALLRWNACVRTIRRHGLHPPAKEHESQLE
jgi:hypothetical protein